MSALHALAKALPILAVITACTPNAPAPTGGETLWLEVEQGRLKAQVFARENVVDRPILIVILHGDIPDARPDYHYLVAKAITIGWSDLPERSAALRAALGKDWRDDDVVAAGVLRPGYADPSGDRSSGDMGRALADNHTPEVVDAIASATRQLREMYDARAVVLVGHSGGGAIVANVLGRHRDLADGALLVGCGHARSMKPLGPEEAAKMTDMLLRRQLSSDLRLAMKAKDTIAISALRSVLSALDNASAVPASGVAAAVFGRNGDVPRRELSAADCQRIIRAEASSRAAAAPAARYQAGFPGGAAQASLPSL